MGGPGSGNFYQWQRHPTKRTVESCLSLSTRFLVRNRYLAVGVYSTGSVFWGSGPDAPSVSFAVDTLDDDRPVLTLTYRVGMDPDLLRYEVRLAVTRPPFGGVRWWFVCPAVGCGRQAAKLHLPAGGRYFACRRCHRLTYASTQESGRFDALFRRLAAEMGTDAKSVKWALNRIGKRP